MDQITEEQQKVIDELKKRTIKYVTPKMLEDVSLFYRFSKAREFNLEEAEAMLRKHITWRKEMQIDAILTDYEPAEVLVKYVPTSIMCFGNDQSIVRFNDGGHTDIKGLWNVSSLAEFTRFICYLLERDKNTMIQNGINLGKPMYSAVYDLADLSYTNAVSIKTLKFIVHILKIFVDNYPETVRRIIIFNAPSYFTLMYTTVKRVLPDSIIQKFRVHGRDGWKEDLLRFIDADDLPMYLGGNKTDPDGNPRCETIILHGRPIPKSYCMNKREKKLSLESDVEKLTVMPFSREEITFEVKEENSYLEWEFETKHRDINFSLYFTEDFEPLEIIPQQKIDTAFETEKGIFKCEKIGKYTIVFDNSYSWIHSKEVYYKAELRGPRNDDIYNAM